MEVLIQKSKPLIIAGPCVAENYELLEEVGTFLSALSKKLDFTYVFKASFDKANRSSFDSYRGPGITQGVEWFTRLKAKLNCPVLTDIHETAQVEEVAQVCDVLQIPAFLCRQTDLLLAAVKTGKFINIKKGQFMAPTAMKHIAGKAKAYAKKEGLEPRLALTERGFSFGYGDLVVDMRSLAVMAQEGVPVIFDITHSTQRPPNSDGQVTSKADRVYAPLLARAATATGYLDGYFLEVHPNPKAAKSDADAQLTLKQAELLLTQLIPLWHESKKMQKIDTEF
jgi:2-dehydro-3-deoxyphosphooctonate aldolase (KDO 8-P synthase)